MTITTHRIETGYDDTVYNFIKHEEAVVRRVYSDPLGIPTLGVGYALIVEAPAGSRFPYQLRDDLAINLAAIGITLSKADEDLLDSLLRNLNAGNGLANIGTGPNQVPRAIIESDADGNPIENSLNSAGLNEFSFGLLSDNQVRQLYDRSIADIRTQIQTQFRSRLTKLAATDPTITNPVAAADTLFASLDGSQEMVALSSLAFTNPGKLIGPNLTAALYYGDRAEAWYNIRYDSNKGGSHANRRYREAEQFNLYNDINNITDDDAKGAYRTFTRHAEDIRFYEGFYPPQFASDNTVQITAIQAQLESARSWLISNYIDLEGIGITVDWDHIQVGEDSTTTYYHGTDDDYLTGSDNSDLIFGESGNDILQGNLGDDVLYGGTGVDIYKYRPGDGNDILKDEDGQGALIYDPNGSPQGLAAGLRKPTDPSGEWKSPDGQFIYRWSGTPGDDLTIQTPTGTLTVKNYKANDLNIRLVDLPVEPGDGLAPITNVQTSADNTLTTITGTAAPEITAGTSINDNIAGNGGGDRLSGGAGDDQITNGPGDDYLDGGIGRDILIATDGNDHLVGGPNDTTDTADALQGGDGDDTIEGGFGDDVLDGGRGHDVIHGGKGHDHIQGSAGLTAQNRDWSVTSINGVRTFNRFSGNTDNTFNTDGLSDALFGDEGNDTLIGGYGDDYLDGGADNDALNANDGNDTLLGGNGNDVLVGHEGHDQLVGGAGNDDLHGDTNLTGTPLGANSNGNDYLDGGAGIDRLYGGGGNGYLPLAA